MLKKILMLLMSLALVLSIAACGGCSTTMKVTDDDLSSQTVNLESLKSQIQNATPMIDYLGNTPIDQMDVVTFGLDENSQPIEWLVLEKNNNKALLISKYILIRHSYNDEDVDITWENCTMRKWLNSKYINIIFSKKEQDSILTTDVVNNDNAYYETKGGKNTRDKLFLLSVDEVKKYFVNSQRVAFYKGGSSGNWWLRSPGNFQFNATCVHYIDYLDELGGHVSIASGVRPAIWVKY